MSKRWRRIAFTPELFVDVMTHGMAETVVAENGLPKDARFAACTFDPTGHGCLDLR